MNMKEFDQLMDLFNMKISNAIKDVLDHTTDTDKLDEAELEAKVRQSLINKEPKTTGE